MTSTLIKYFNKTRTIIIIVGSLLFFQLPTHAQEKPPRPIAVYVSPVQGLSFGKIIMGASGGTVTVSPTGSRSSTGSVILVDNGVSWTPALFEIEANSGTLINIVNGPDAVLTGSNGGSLTLEIGGSDPVSPFVIITSYPTRTYLRIGGTLIIGAPASNPRGSYNGTFIINFFQE